MTKLIMNADDFGYCESVNDAIISAHLNGIVSSTTVMAGMPGFEHGVELLKQTPTLKAGVHMTLTCGRPVLKNHKTIVDENGNFFKRLNPEIISNMDEEEIFNEFCAQIDKVMEAGIDVSHLDSHHHIHGALFLQNVVQKISKKYNLPMRGMFKYDYSNLEIEVVPHPVNFYQDSVSEEFFELNFDEISKHEIIDAMCHPGFLSDFLMGSTSYNVQRKKEHDVLTSSYIKESIKKLDIYLTNYKEM